MSIWDDPEVQAFLERAEREMAPRMEQSAMSLSIVPPGHGDAKFWVELGAAIMMEKPIILLALAGRPLPQRLQAVADEIIVIPEGESVESMADEIARVIHRAVEGRS